MTKLLSRVRIPLGVSLIHEYPFKIGSLVIGVYGTSHNWRDVIRNLHNAEMYEVLHEKIYNLGEPGEKTMVCPKPVHKTDITSSKKMRILTVREDQFPIYRGAEADGAEIEKGEVYALASGDCPTVAIHDKRTLKTTALHFNRENGVDNTILQGALRRFADSNKEDLVATISCGIGPKHFSHSWDHERFGNKNQERTTRVLAEYGYGAIAYPIESGGLNLRFIASKILSRFGIASKNIFVDQIDTYTDPQFWSHRASMDPASSKYGLDGRNLVLVHSS